MDALREWRESLPASTNTLKDAARLLGVSPSQLGRYERGLRQIKPSRVREFETITGIPRHILRPDLYDNLTA